MARVTDDGSDVDDSDDFDVDNMDFDLPSSSSLPVPSGSSSRSAHPAFSSPQQALLSQFTGEAGPSSVSHASGSTRMLPASEVGKFKHYIQLYPIYIDISHPHKNGARRVNKAKAVAYPKAQEIAEVCGRFLGLQPVLEMETRHPKDWQNPGRVRVLIKEQGENGRLYNKDIPDKLTLLNKICEIIKHLRAQAKIDPLTSKLVTSRLPYHSPAISFGTYSESLKGGGKMAEMMRGMLGGGAMPGSGGEIEGGGGPSEEETKRVKEEKENAEKQRMAKMKALQKQGRRAVRR